MSRIMVSTCRVLTTLVGTLALAAGVSAQATQTKETAPGGGPTKTTTIVVKGELVYKGTNWLVAKDAAGDHKVYNVEPGRKAIVDGVPKTLDQIPVGTVLTSTATTTETPMVTRTKTITKGEVLWASSKSLIALVDGETKQYEVPEGFKFDVDGQQVPVTSLKKGMKLTATRIVEEPMNVITKDIVVTGTAPK
jgi:hypothetical protein